MKAQSEDLVFCPLGGLGEIGMNAALYGYGAASQRQWIMADCGLSFAGPETPGVDLVFPDLSFIAKQRKALLGLIVTHAHEDHIGAIANLWPRLKCPIYATPFAAGLLQARRLSEPGAPTPPIHEIRPGGRISLGPFDIEFVPVAHSIPEACALAIRTPAGLVVHSGDWKIDPEPGVGFKTDEARLRAIGEEGVLALISDSTNILREGHSPSEGEVAKALRDCIAQAPERVLVTTFASNIARLRAVCLAGQAMGRQVIVSGRAMERAIQVARECGLFEGVGVLLSMEAFASVPPHKALILATGSQGEPRAAMARIARNDHPIKLTPGDRVIFSARAIPGNEREVGQIINALTVQGVDVVTDRDALVHCSGHPRRDEVQQLYQWLKPKIAIPAHGEAMHLRAHAEFARAQGVPHVLTAYNGDMIALDAETPRFLNPVTHGRLYLDGDVLIEATDEAIDTRRKLAFAGVVTIALAISDKGDLVGAPDMLASGLPTVGNDGKPIDEAIDRALFDTLDHLPRAKRRDADAVVSALERAIRAAVHRVWGKKPLVHVLVIEA